MNIEIIKNITKEINNQFHENHLWADAYFGEREFSTVYEIKVYIDNGDWKHDHLRAVNIVKQILGENFKDHFEEVTESNGSDCYSSVHTFTTNIKYREKLVLELADF